MESLQAFGAVGQYIVCAALGVYGAMLAVGRTRLESGLVPEPASSRRSRLSGVFLVVGQVLCVLFLLSGRSPVSPFVLIVGTFAFSMLFGWIIDKALPRVAT
jgi:hypothetical protein